MSDEDLGHLTTEGVRTEFRDIDKLPTIELLQLINAQDATVADAVAKALPVVAAAVPAIVARMRRAGRIVYVGAGTSGRLGVLDAAECGPTFNAADQVVAIIAGGPSAVINASEGTEDDRAAAVRDLQAFGIRSDDSVIGLSASGRTPYVCEAVTYARECGALTVGISCNTDTELSALVDFGIEVETGPEVIAGSTRMKAATAQKMLLNMISSAAMIMLGKTYGNMMVDLRISNQKLMGRGIRMVAELAGVSEAQATTALEASHLNVRAALDLLQAQTRTAQSAQ